MEFLISLIPFAMLVGLVWFLVWAVRDAAQLKGGDQVLWICLIVLFFPLGAIAYLIANPRHKQ